MTSQRPADKLWEREVQYIAANQAEKAMVVALLLEGHSCQDCSPLPQCHRHLSEGLTICMLWGPRPSQWGKP
jgi:hypothetical protein